MRGLGDPAAGSPFEAGVPSLASGARRVLIADSDSGFVRVLEKRLAAAGWEPRMAAAGAGELQRARARCLVVDPFTWSDDPWGLLEDLCGTSPWAVIVCSSPTTVAERVRGLRLGADDWVTKPCHPEEVVARLEAVSRRLHASRPDTKAVRAGEL